MPSGYITAFYSLPSVAFSLRKKPWLTKALALTCGAVHVDLGTDDVAEWHEHLGELSITELLWQVVDEQVTTFRSYLEKIESSG